MPEKTNYGKLNERLEAIMVEAEADYKAVQGGTLSPNIAVVRQEIRRVTLANISLFLQWGLALSPTPSPQEVQQ